MKKVLIIFALISSMAFSHSFAQDFIEQENIEIPGVQYSSVVWGDYNNDGFLDILVTGLSESGPFSKIYRNNGDGTFTAKTNISLVGVAQGSVVWGDYKNDGFLDILITGDTGSQRVAKIYRNNGDETFTEQTGLYLPGIANGSVAWGDYNNDGYLDILLTGSTNSERVSKVYRNNRDGSFIEQTAIVLPGVSASSVAWGDYDNDGYLDILLTGSTGTENISKIYRNNGDGEFIEQTGISLQGVFGSSVAWGDYNNDGFLDIIIAGFTGSERVTKVYRNNGNGTFTEQTSISLVGLAQCSVAWGDYNNDGLIDILLAGEQAPWNYVTKIYQNNGDGSFSEQSAISLDGVYRCSLAWADYNNDGKLDILLTGTTGISFISKLYKNNVEPSNTKTQEINNLAHEVNGSNVTFTWDAGTDINQSGGLNYNIYVFDAELNRYAVNPHALIEPQELNGKRMVAKMGGIQNTSYTVKNLLSGNYSWGVQAVDASFEGGLFAQGQSFSISGNKVFPAEKQLIGVVAGQPLSVWEMPAASSREWKYATSIEGSFQSFIPAQTYESYTPYFHEQGTYFIRCESIINSQIFSSNAVEIEVKWLIEQDQIDLLKVSQGTAAWGDYDNDGYMDILITGSTSTGTIISKIYRNNGNGSFSELTESTLIGFYFSSAEWSDYDNDGYIDLAITGSWATNEYSTKIYRNNGGGTFTEQDHQIELFRYSKLAWGDFDNDGYIDLIITGMLGSEYATHIYKNNGEGGFVRHLFTPLLVGITSGDIAIADYNNDGFLDILITGQDDQGDYIAKLYRNTGNGNFTEVTGLSLPGVYLSSVDWGDYNNDGYLDILLSGSVNSENTGNYISKVYKNNGDGTFTEVSQASLQGVCRGSAVWGDFNNDGLIDIVIAGATAPSYGSPTTKIYRNNGDDSFTEQTDIELTGLHSCSFAWADYDNDGHIDLLISGQSGTQRISKIIKNNSTPEANSKPQEITGLNAEHNGSEISFSWSKASDDNQDDGLSYNLYMYDVNVDEYRVSGNAFPYGHDNNGQRLVAKMGNIQGIRNENTISYSLNGFDEPCKEYRYSIQAVDASFEGGSFAQEQTIIFPGNRVEPFEKQFIGTNQIGQMLIVQELPIQATSREWKFASSIDGPYFSFNPSQNNTSFTPLFDEQGVYFVRCESVVSDITYHSNSVEIDVRLFVGQQDIDLSGVRRSSVAWGDYNNDGFLDILVTGLSTSGPISKIYCNNGDGTFTEQTNISLVGVAQGSVAWGDYNNDGYLDILITGDTGSQKIAKIYRNNGNGTFAEQTGIALAGIANGSVAWGDYNNDGYLDILLTGSTNSERVSKVYRNNRNGSFTEQTGIGLPGVSASSVAWGDYDNDGYLDILLTGSTGTENISKIYRNNGDGEFIEQTGISLQGVFGSSVAWGDYNNDGFLDIIIAGFTGSELVTKVYRNNGEEAFDEQPAISLTGVADGCVAWGDYNNDGLLDFALTGNWDGQITGGFSRIYKNDGNGNFIEQDNIILDGIYESSISWCDFNNDGSLDLLISGYSINGSITKLFQNYSNATPNTKPQIVTNLQSVIDGTDVILSWDVGSDTNQSDGLNYGIYVYNQQTLEYLVAGQAFPQTDDLNGKRLVARIGSIQGNRQFNSISYTLKNFAEQCKNYSWSVQAVDACFDGGEFAPEQTFFNDGFSPVPDEDTLPSITAECSVASLTAPTASDNCAGTITGTLDTTLPIIQNTTITWTYDDGNGNTSSQTQAVVIMDITPPVLDEPSLPQLTGECSVTVTATPTATDNCSGTIIGTTTDPMTYTEQGTYTITWTYEDGNGNTSTQTQAVIVDDVTAPVPDIASLPDITAQCSVTSLTAPTASDNCAGTITGTLDATLPIIQNTTITWTYDDGNGNTSSQAQAVVIMDITPPVLDEPSLPQLTGECSVTVTATPTATDNCSGTIIGTTTDPMTYTEQGPYTIIWTYSDGNGNTSTQTQTVIVDDVTAPVPDEPSLPQLTGECSVTVTTTPTATDNCAGSVTGTTTDPMTYTEQGTYTITWTYDDGHGNTSTQTQAVIVEDVTAPVPDEPSLPQLTGECSVIVTTTPTATDNCSGTIIGTTTDPMTYTEQGTYTITWTYDDGNGNTSTQTQAVIVDDVTAPMPDIASLPDITAQCSVTSLTAPTATDNCAGSVTGTTTDPMTYTEQGTYTITWTYDDGHGNTSTQTQAVIVEDVTAPVPDEPSLPQLTGECSVIVTTTPTATDNCSGTIIGTTTDPMTYTEQGTYTITWTYDDGNGNTSTQTQAVIVDDVTAPVPDIASLPDITAQCSVTSLTAPTATDNCAGTITGTLDATLPIIQNTTITWTYDDGNGNTSTQTQAVIVDDVTAPVPDIASLPDITAQCSVTSLTAPTASDNCAGTITGTLDATLPIIQNTTITWTYDDGNGNTSSQAQAVVIMDITPPVLDEPSLPQLTGACSVIVTTTPTATDNCSGTIIGTTTDPMTYTEQGTYTITWTYDDGNGNTTTQTQTVVVEDLIAPELSCVDNHTINLEQDQSFYTVQGNELDPIEVTDNCGIQSLSNSLNNLSTLAGTIFSPGNHTIIWTASDNSGNINECSFEIIVNLYVGIPDLQINEVALYPNPTKDIIHIHFKDDSIKQIKVIDITGKTLVDNLIVRKFESIDFSLLDKGIYIIIIHSNNYATTKKVVKQ